MYMPDVGRGHIKKRKTEECSNKDINMSGFGSRHIRKRLEENTLTRI